MTDTQTKSTGRTLRKRISTETNSIQSTTNITNSINNHTNSTISNDRISVTPHNKLPNGKRIRFTIDSTNTNKSNNHNAAKHNDNNDSNDDVKQNNDEDDELTEDDNRSTDISMDDADSTQPNTYGGFMPQSHLSTPTSYSTSNELIQYQTITRRNINSYRKWASSRRQRMLSDRYDLFEPFLIESQRKKHNKSIDQSNQLNNHNTTNIIKPMISLKHSVPPYLESTPPYINAQLRSYQLSGVNWIISHFDCGVGCILGDEMGLGKTIQSLTFISYLKHCRHMNGPSIVVCPLAVASNWINEIKKFCMDLTYIKFQGGVAERDVLLDDMRLTSGSYDIVITTYETFIAEMDFFQDKSMRWLNVIVDEAHRIKSATARLREGLCGIKSGFQLLLTGTPLQNNLHELWSLLDYLLPDVRLDPKIFLKSFNLDTKEIHTHLIPKAAALLDSIMLRRTKQQVESSLPPKTLINVYVPLTKLQIKLYRRLLMKDVGLENSLSYSQLMFVLVQLRKVCNHPSTLFIHRFNANDTKYKALYNHLQKNDIELDSLITHRRDIFQKFAPPAIQKPTHTRRRHNHERVRNNQINHSNTTGNINELTNHTVKHELQHIPSILNDTVDTGNDMNSSQMSIDTSTDDIKNNEQHSIKRSRSSDELDMNDTPDTPLMNNQSNSLNNNVPQSSPTSFNTTQSSSNQFLSYQRDSNHSYNPSPDIVRRHCRHQCGCRDSRSGEIGPPAVFYSNSWWKHEANVRIHPRCDDTCAQHDFLKRNSGFDNKARISKNNDNTSNIKKQYIQLLENTLQHNQNTATSTNTTSDSVPSSGNKSDTLQSSTAPVYKRSSAGRRPKTGYADIDDVNLPYTSHTVLDEGGSLIQLHACRHQCGCVNRMTGQSINHGKPAAFTHRGSRYSHELRATLHPNCHSSLECYKLIIKGELKDQQQQYDFMHHKTHNHIIQSVDTQQLNAHMSYHEQLKLKIEQQRKTSTASQSYMNSNNSNDVKHEHTNTSTANDIQLPTKSDLITDNINHTVMNESNDVGRDDICDNDTSTDNVASSGSLQAELNIDDSVGEVIEIYRAIALDSDYIIFVVLIERDGTVVCEIEANQLHHVEIDVNNISESDLDYRFMPIDQLIRASGKLTIMHKLLQRLHSEGSRVLIFTHFTSCLDVLERYVLEQQWQYKRMDGQTNRVIRELDIRDFNKHSEYFIYLISTKSGGQGINLASADVVILYDCDWNPQLDLQAEDRAHRIGQKKPVCVYRLVTECSVEERIVQRAMKKLALDSMVVGKGGTGQRNQLKAAAHAAQAQLDADNSASTELLSSDTSENKQIGSREVFNMLKYGADTIFRSSGTDISDVDLDALLSRSKRHEEDKHIYAESPDSDIDIELGGIQTIFMQDWKERLPDEDVTVDESSKHDHAMLKDSIDNMISENDNDNVSDIDNDDSKLICSNCQSVNDIDLNDDTINEISCMNCNTILPVLRTESPNQSIDSKSSQVRTSISGGLDAENIISDTDIDPVTGRRLRMRAARLKPIQQFQQEPIKRESIKPKMQHENECFVCEEYSCNIECSQCPKVYHTACINLAGIPKGRWACGWHHCSVCYKGKSLVGGILFSCISCPTSYCFDDLPDTVRILRLKSDHQVIQKLKSNHYKVNFDNLMFYQCDTCRNKYSVLVDVAQAQRQHHDEIIKQKQLYEQTKLMNRQSNEMRKRKKLHDEVQRAEYKRTRECESMCHAEAYDIQYRYSDRQLNAQQEYCIQLHQQLHTQQQIVNNQLQLHQPTHSPQPVVTVKKQRNSSVTLSIDDSDTNSVQPGSDAGTTRFNGVNITKQSNRTTPTTNQQTIGIDLPLPQPYRNDNLSQTIIPYVDRAIPGMPMQQYILLNSFARCRYCHHTDQPYIQFIIPSIKSIQQSHLHQLCTMVTKKQLKSLKSMRDADIKQLRAHESTCAHRNGHNDIPEYAEQSNLQYSLPLNTYPQHQLQSSMTMQPVYAYPYQPTYYPHTHAPPPLTLPVQQSNTSNDIQQRLQHPALTQFASINLYPTADEVIQLSQITQAHMSIIYEWFDAERQRVNAPSYDQYIQQQHAHVQSHVDAIRCDWSTAPSTLLSTQQRINFYQSLYISLTGMHTQSQPVLDYPHILSHSIDLYIYWWHAIMEGLPSIWQYKQWQLFVEHIELPCTAEQLQLITNDIVQIFFYYRLNQFNAPIHDQLQARELANCLRSSVNKLESCAVEYNDTDEYQWVNDIALLAGVDLLGIQQLQYIRVHPYLGARLKQYDTQSLQQRYNTLQQIQSSNNNNNNSSNNSTIKNQSIQVFSAKVVSGNNNNNISNTNTITELPSITVDTDEQKIDSGSPGSERSSKSASNTAT